jgi:hypothetical protein
MTLASHFEADVRAQFARQPLADETMVRDEDLAHLPRLVATYLRRTGAVGAPVIHNFRVIFDATMYRSPEQPLASDAVQYEFVDDPSRYFFLRTRMIGLPVRVLHEYEASAAHMQVRVAGLVNLVNERGPALSRAETVTILNDLCIMAPSALIDPRFAFTPRSDHEVGVRFTHGEHRVQATLVFDAEGDLVDFRSDDRHALPDDGDRWTTPLRNYQSFCGRRIATEGDALWHYASGREFKYGTFRIHDIRWNLTSF